MRGVLLLNTGSPKTSQRKDVKAFIRAMLSDPYVMTVPDWFRPILVDGIIIPLRQFASTSHYKQIWGKQPDSPLLKNSKQLAEKLETFTGMPVEVAMRYGQPDIQSALKRLMEKNDKLHEVVILPLFPQYAESSYKTTIDEVGKVFFKQPYPFRLRFIEPYYAHPAYIGALAQSIKPHIKNDFDRLYFSFHSLPLSHVEEGWKKGREFDYVYQAKETVRLLQKELNLNPRKTRLVYHSAMREDWLRPDLEETVKELASEGERNIVIVTPGFAADNLETLYDINIKTKKTFLKEGGKHFTSVPCLNSEDFWVESIAKIIS